MQPVYRPLDLGSVKPLGWFKDQLELEAAGLSGNMFDFYRFVHDSRWIGGETEYSHLEYVFITYAVFLLRVLVLICVYLCLYSLKNEGAPTRGDYVTISKKSERKTPLTYKGARRYFFFISFHN